MGQPHLGIGRQGGPGDLVGTLEQHREMEIHFDMKNCAHDLPTNLCMICESSASSRFQGILDGIDASPQQAPGEQAPTKSAYCIACKEHSGRLEYIDPPFISWQCKKCVLIWLTVITNDTSVGTAVAAQALVSIPQEDGKGKDWRWKGNLK